MAKFKPQNYEHLIGEYWRFEGYEYKLHGIMYGEDDWYWVMTRGNRFDEHTQLLSCVGDIEDFGFWRIE